MAKVLASMTQAWPAVCPVCGRVHRSWLEVAACVFPKTDFRGDGPYAVLSCRCGRPPWWGHATGQLFFLEARASEARRQLDGHGCGPGCVGRHQLVNLTWHGEGG